MQDGSPLGSFGQHPCPLSPLVRWVGLSGLEPLTPALSGRFSSLVVTLQRLLVVAEGASTRLDTGVRVHHRLSPPARLPRAPAPLARPRQDQQCSRLLPGRWSGRHHWGPGFALSHLLQHWCDSVEDCSAGLSLSCGTPAMMLDLRSTVTVLQYTRALHGRG